jgi:hypothetical protein
LREDGAVLAWGDNRYGSTSVPPGLSNVVKVAAGGTDGIDHSLALQNPLPHPKPVLTIDRDGSPCVRIAGASRNRYVLEETASLGPNSHWQFKLNILLTNTTQRILDLTSAKADARFYRVRLMR